MAERIAGAAPVRRGVRLSDVGLWLVLLVLLAPVAALLADALSGALASLPLKRTAGLALNTLMLGLASCAFAACWGCATAWLVETCEFVGRRFFALALFLPFAVPPYLLGYVWADLIDDGGWLWSGLKVRNALGAAVIMSLALYPYVYLLARAAFAQRSCGLLAAARLLGCTPWAAFVRVALPAARPALALGALLVFMEAINDIAIAEDFGLATLGLHVLDLWQVRDDRSAAAGIGLLLLALAALLAWAEAFSRRRQRQYQLAAHCYCSEARYQLSPAKQLAAVAGCGALLALAFGVPLGVLLVKALRAGSLANPELWSAVLDSLRIVALAALAAFVLGALLAAVARRKVPLSNFAAKLAMAGYAVPGTVYALGFFLAATALADALMQHVGISVHWLWTSSASLLVVAIACRFVVVCAGAIETGLSQMPKQLATAARSSGAGAGSRLLRVYLPVCRPALAAGFMLLAVDVLKELPLTLLLRPFGLTPLSLHIYQHAADEDLGGAAAAALLLLLVASAALLVGLRWIRPVWERRHKPMRDK